MIQLTYLKSMKYLLRINNIEKGEYIKVTLLFIYSLATIINCMIRNNNFYDFLFDTSS